MQSRSNEKFPSGMETTSRFGTSQLVVHINEDGSVVLTLKQPPIENVCFEGGGPRGLVYIGTIDVLEGSGIYSNLKRVIGSSAGALTATVAALYPSGERAAQILAEVDTMKLLNEATAKLLNNTRSMAFKIMTEGYLDNGDNLLNFIRKTIADKMEELITLYPTNTAIQIAHAKYGDITFEDLHNIQISCPEARIKDLIITGTKVTERNETVIFDYLHSPTMSIALAARISASIPLFFQQVSYQGPNDNMVHKFIDGGCMNNFPIEILDSPDYAPASFLIVKYRGDLYENKCTIGFKVDHSSEIAQLQSVNAQSVFKLDTITDILNTLIGSFSANSPLTGQIDAAKTMFIYKAQTCPIDDCRVTLFSFNLSEAEKLRLIKTGRETTEKWVKSLQLDNPLEETVASNFTEACQKMELGQLRKFCEILSQQPEAVFTSSEQFRKGIIYGVNYGTAKKVLTEREEKEAKPQFQNPIVFFNWHLKEKSFFNIIHVLLKTISIDVLEGEKAEKLGKKPSDSKNKEVELSSVSKSAESSSVEISKKNLPLLTKKFQEYYLNKSLAMLKATLSQFHIEEGEAELNSVFYQIVLPTLNLGNESSYLVKFLNDSAIRYQVSQKDSIYRNVVHQLYYALYQILIKEEAKLIVNIDNVLNKLNDNYAKIDAIVYEIDTHFSHKSEADKAKYFLKQVKEAFRNDLGVNEALATISKDKSLREFDKISSQEFVKSTSLHPLFDSFKSQVIIALSMKKPESLIEFVKKLLAENSSQIKKELDQWKLANLDKIIFGELRNMYGKTSRNVNFVDPLQSNDNNETSEMSEENAVFEKFGKVPEKLNEMIKEAMAIMHIRPSTVAPSSPTVTARDINRSSPPNTRSNVNPPLPSATTRSNVSGNPWSSPSKKNRSFSLSPQQLQLFPKNDWTNSDEFADFKKFIHDCFERAFDAIINEKTKGVSSVLNDISSYLKKCPQPLMQEQKEILFAIVDSEADTFQKFYNKKIILGLKENFKDTISQYFVELSHRYSRS